MSAASIAAMHEAHQADGQEGAEAQRHRVERRAIARERPGAQRGRARDAPEARDQEAADEEEAVRV